MANFDNIPVGEKLNTRMSRWIASWVNSGGKVNDPLFKEWLSGYGMKPEEVDDIVEFATCGKIELELDAQEFLKAHKPETKEEERHILTADKFLEGVSFDKEKADKFKRMIKRFKTSCNTRMDELRENAENIIDQINNLETELLLDFLEADEKTRNDFVFGRSPFQAITEGLEKLGTNYGDVSDVFDGICADVTYEVADSSENTAVRVTGKLAVKRSGYAEYKDIDEKA